MGHHAYVFIFSSLIHQRMLAPCLGCCEKRGSKQGSSEVSKMLIPFLLDIDPIVGSQDEGRWFSDVPKPAAHDLPVFPLLCSMTFKSYFGCSSWVPSNAFIWIRHWYIATWMSLHSCIKPARWKLLEVWDTLHCEGVRGKIKNIKAIINKIMLTRGKYFSCMQLAKHSEGICGEHKC